MKIFRFFTDNKCKDDALYSIKVATIPDTALLIQKRPFFIPDFTQHCTAQPCFCVRINRLGRSIAKRFANRYYATSEVTLAVHFVASDLLNTLLTKQQPWDMAIGFDNAVAVAETKIPLLCEETLAGIKINDDEVSAIINGQQYLDLADEQIERISEHYTLRQGDLLLLPLPIEPPIVHIDNRLALTIGNSQEVLAFNIK